MTTEIEKKWRQEDLFKRSFDEYTLCIRTVLEEAESILKSPPHTPAEFEVGLAAIPEEAYALGRNLFSTLFQSVYHLLKIDGPRRHLYGTLNHLFRIWVTSADNLLDNEDKVVVPIEMAGSSRVMRQVLSIMLADRVLKNIIDKAVHERILRDEQGALITHKTLQILLPSAAEEASEENGIACRPDAEYVLDTIHRLKTGLLFHVPFLGPDHIEDELDHDTLTLCKDGLMSFGIGCQILDDIRDLAKDHLEARHNYVLSRLFAENPMYIETLREIEPVIDVSSNVFHLFPDVVRPAADRALGLLTNGLLSLGLAGLGINRAAAVLLSLSMFETLGVGELIVCLSV